jgi:dynein heavy chain
MKLCCMNQLHLLMPGPTGTGKSIYALSFLAELSQSDRWTGMSLVLSAQTSSNQVLDTIFIQLMKWKGKLWGPEGGKTMVCLVDDMNMPKKEEYGAQPPIELLRMYLDHKAWYIISRNKEYTSLTDIVLLGCMGPPGGGRTFITPRIVRHFNIIAYTDISKEETHRIFSTLLNHFLKRLPEDIRNQIDNLIIGSVEIYNRVRKTLKPIPSKSHYTFNLRDIAKVFQGVSSACAKEAKDVPYVVKLWYHENMRVYHDRLTTDDDRQFIKAQLSDLFQIFGCKEEEVLTSERVIFCDFMDKGSMGDLPDYIQVDDMNRLEKQLAYLQEIHDQQAKSKDKLDLVLFSDACEHVTRITRVLRQPQGNVLLLGVGGSGRQSLTRLSVFIRGMVLKGIQVVKGYNLAKWREDLKVMLINIIEKNQPICFLIVDTQIIDEQMVEDINCLLNSGWVVGLPFSVEDLEKLDELGKKICGDNRLPANKINIYSSQVGRIKKNLHVSFAMSPLGEAFFTRMRMFPSLNNCCTIDWFTEWPEEALMRVGTKQIMYEAEELKIESIMDQLVDMFRYIHKSVEKQTIRYKNEARRSNYVTPTSYLELLSLFKSILAKKISENIKAIQRLENGIYQLEQANAQVDSLKLRLREEEPELIKTEEEVKLFLEELKKDEEKTREEEKIVTKEKEKAKEKEEEATAIAREIEFEVSKVDIQLKNAATEVEKLEKGAISEVGSFPKPPDAIKTLALAIMILLSEDIDRYPIKKDHKEMETDAWMKFKTATKQASLKQDMIGVMTRLERKQIDLIRKYVEGNLKRTQTGEFEIWNLQKMKDISVAGAVFWCYIDVMCRFSDKIEETKPLREKEAQTNALLKEKREFVAMKEKELSIVKQNLYQLQNDLASKREFLSALKKKIDDCQVKLERARKLTYLLGDESKRWVEEISRLKSEEEFIPGNTLIGAGMVAYSGPFTSEYRSELERSWVERMIELKIPVTPGITMRKYLVDPIKLQHWNINGLPKDDSSTENGLIIEYSKRWPLMIDPQNQANKYIKKMSKEHSEGTEIIKANSPNLLKVFDHAIPAGKMILIENMPVNIDPALEPILLRQVTVEKMGRGKTITLGDKTLSYHDSFKFYMTTTNPNPHYSPETCAKITIINFGITMTGLIEQMLAVIVILENRKLEDMKNEIIRSNADDRAELFELENKILSSLSESQGTILEQDTIIDQLASSKSKSKTIMQRVADSKKAEETIDSEREHFRKVAIRTSLLFFCIVDLANIDPMYQYSLQWFETLFKNTVENATQPTKKKEERLELLMKCFTEALYKNICRSLFGKHKLLFSFLMCVRILIGEGDNGEVFDEVAYRYLLAGPSGDLKTPPNHSQFVNSETSWKEIYFQFYGMNQLPKYKGILDHFMNQIEEWRPLYESNDPVLEKMPAVWEEKMSIFDKILVIKSLRPDKVTNAIQDYVEKKMGKFYIEIPIVKLQECFDDSSPSIPLIFILSQGSDPKSDFDSFANNKEMTDPKSISLGQGQGERATKLIEAAVPNGGWVLLQNCHLATSWMNELELLVEKLAEPNVHKDFRLWLTSMPSAGFPVSILQNSVKMTIEPPQGIRDNLKKSFEGITDEELNDTRKPFDFKKLLYGLCFFHAIIQDRRKFGAIGWNIAYEFTFEDLEVCRKQLKIFLDQYDTTDYDVIKVICADINYGGRVTDKKDIRLINSIISKFICKEILSDEYDFSGETIYTSPKIGNQSDYLDVISKLPLNASPEIFGLHPNAAITYAQNTTRVMMETLLSIQPRSSGNSSISRESIITKTTDFLQERCPKVYDLEKIKKIYPPDDYNESMNTVLVQEIVRVNRLLEVIEQRLIDVKLGIKGEVVMSKELENIANSFFLQAVPAEWQYPLGFLSLKSLYAWVEELQQRTAFFTQWINNGAPSTFWFSGFFFPQAFITGTHQNYARKHSISIDQLRFEYELRPDIDPLNHKEKPETGIYVYGIYLEGARYDTRIKALNHSRPKEIYSELPVLHLKPIVGEETTVS